MVSRDGGIGRRAGFKIRYWQQCVGSTPTLGTTSRIKSCQVGNYINHVLSGEICDDR